MSQTSNISPSASALWEVKKFGVMNCSADLGPYFPFQLTPQGSEQQRSPEQSVAGTVSPSPPRAGFDDTCSWVGAFEEKEGGARRESRSPSERQAFSRGVSVLHV